MARISLNMRCSTNNIPFSYLYIHEYSTNNFENYEHYKYISITTSNKNNEYFTSFKYSNYENKTQYIALLIRPSYNIDLLTSKIDVVDNKYDLSPKNKKTIYNLMSDDVYYFYIDTSENNKIEVTFTSNDLFSLNMNIYELEYSYSLVKDYPYYGRGDFLDSNNNSFTYTSSISNKKVAIEITLNTDINSISAEFKYPVSGLFIFTIVLCILFLVFVIVCFYKRYKTKSKNEFDNSAQSGPLYSANESSNYQQQYIGQPLKNAQF
jgi:cbb3-type cytochrome oxidase subunit 3